MIYTTNSNNNLSERAAPNTQQIKITRRGKLVDILVKKNYFVFLLNMEVIEMTEKCSYPLVSKYASYVEQVI